MSEIKNTNDYRLFKLRDDNRNVQESHVLKLMKSIKKMDFTEANPVIINENNEIIDGQHRFEACKRLEYPIYYTSINLNGKSGDAMINANITQKNWSLDDYVKYYSSKPDLKYDDYRYLKYFNAKHPLSIGNCASVVANYAGGAHKEIKSGIFKKGNKDPEEIMHVLYSYIDIFKFAKTNNFIRTIIRIVRSGKYIHKIHYLKIEKNRRDCTECATVDQYIKMFEQYINKGKSYKYRVTF